MTKNQAGVGRFVFNVFNVGFTVVMFILPTIGLVYWYLYIRNPKPPVQDQPVANQIADDPIAKEDAPPLPGPQPKDNDRASPVFNVGAANDPPAGAATDSAVEPDRSNQREEQEMRTWQDASGKFNVVARFYSAVGDEVRLVAEDGRKINVPIARLSEDDKSYLRKLFKSRGVHASF